jgi:flagellar assembly protein FliH
VTDPAEFGGTRPGSNLHALTGDTVLLRGEAAARARKIDLISGVRTVAVDDGMGLASSGGSVESQARELAEARREGRVEGFEQGLRTGFEQGKAEGEAEARTGLEQAQVDASARVEAALSRLDQRLGELADHLSSSTVDLALEIAEAVLAREVRTAQDPGADAIARCLDLLPPLGEMVVRLHPDDAEAFDQVPEAGSREIVVVPDGHLNPGDAIISVDETTVDARLSASLERVAEALR